jgi:NADH dehydrogenase
MNNKKPKIIIVGAGFAGLNAARALKRTDVDILLIDKANHHLFQPLLYQVATASLSPGNIAVPIREVVAKQKNTTVLLADISKIDKENRRIFAQNGDSFDFDYLVVAVGANHSYFNHPEWELFAPGLKTISDALTIRGRVLLSYERAERYAKNASPEKFMTFVIIGGGPTGVEMAGAIAEMAHKSLVNNFRRIDPTKTKVYLIEGENQVLPAFPKDLADKAKRDLETMGVEVLLKTLVTNVTAEGVWLGDRFLESANLIWAAGNQASPLLQTLDIPLDKNKRVIVNKDLSIPDYSNIFVIGDSACSYNKDGAPLPGIAPVAIQQGKYVAGIIKKNIPKEKRLPFTYFDKGMMATIGKAKAVATVGKLKISGYFAWAAWCFIHIFYLISFSNRLLVMIQWAWIYFTNQRSIRLITHDVSENEESLH